MAEGVLLEPELLKRTSLEASIQEGLVASGLLRDAMVMNGILPFSFRKRFFFLIMLKAAIYKGFKNIVQFFK